MSVIAGGSVSILTRDGPFGIESVRGDGGLGHNDLGGSTRRGQALLTPAPAAADRKAGIASARVPLPASPKTGRAGRSRVVSAAIAPASLGDAPGGFGGPGGGSGGGPGVFGGGGGSR